MITVTINGKLLQIPKGKTILEIARKHDIYIPTLCYHESLTPYGGCRLCVVEVIRSSVSSIVSSCTYEVEDGLQINTNSEKVLEVRRLVLQLLLAEAPDAKILQDLAQELGVKPLKRFKPRNELCIACGLCIRACKEIVGVSAIDFAGKGYEKVAASPFFERSPDCIGCGTCYNICPTGAIKLQDIPPGEKLLLPDGTVIIGPARFIDNWKVNLDLRICKQCGEPFAPQFQLEYFTKKVKLPEDFFEVCIHCRQL